VIGDYIIGTCILSSSEHYTEPFETISEIDKFRKSHSNFLLLFSYPSITCLNLYGFQVVLNQQSYMDFKAAA